MTIVDPANFTKCVYELIENDDSIVGRGDIKTAEALAQLFLTGKVGLHYDPKSRCLKWVTTDWLKEKGLKI